jgi:transcriptional regulator of heat shock response
MSNNNGGKTPPLLPPDQDHGGSNNSNGTGTNTKKILQDLKADQEQFYSRICKIAQSEIAASPPYNHQFEKILQNSAKRIAEIDEELKRLEEEQHHLIKLRDTGDDNEMVAVRTATEGEEQKELPPAGAVEEGKEV